VEKPISEVEKSLPRYFCIFKIEFLLILIIPLKKNIFVLF
jgi:hypothetical protein